MSYKILVAEDDADILNLLKIYLESSGFRVLTAQDGEAAWQRIQTEKIDLAVLDVMMPKMDGFNLTQKIRSEYNMPILLLTAKTEDADKILGLNLGADDYMTKPFNPLEVVARVNANLRRFYQLNPASDEKAASSVITLGELKLDTEKWVLRKNETEIILTPNEYKLLAVLMQSPGRVFTKSQLCVAMNGEYYDNYENAMMVHISHLREKIEEDPKSPRYIKNVRGVGYKIEKSDKRGSVFTLLLKNYILLTLFLLLFLTILFIGLLQNMKGIVAEIEPSQILEYNEILAKQSFDDFPIKRVLGANGGILIVDEQNQPIYQKGKALPITNFDVNDIACISEYSFTPEITRNEIISANGQQQISVSILEKHEGKDVFRTYILDKDNNILYQPGDLPMETLTEKQARLLSDSFAPEYSIQKHSFQTSEGKTFTMLLFGDPARPETAETLVSTVFIFIILCLLVYCVITLVFVIFLRKKINKPLNLLCTELNNFKDGESQHTSYRGPKEFVEIFDSFNALSVRLNQSEEERKELEAGRQKMLADISHDLRTPISVVQGYSKALHDGVIPPEQQPQYLEIIEQKANNLSELINTFYEYSKMEHPDYSLNLIPNDICNTLRDYIADRYAELELAGFSVEVDIPETHIMCGMDTAAFRRALDNIVNNSIKHNSKGTTLYVSLTTCEKQVCIVISDDGAGIPAKLRDAIFTPFVVGEASRSNHGSGLGLSITKKIIEAHNGKITLLEEEEVKGTAFEITLPIA